MSVRMTLGDFLNRVQGVYQSIDIRIAAAKLNNDVWHNALTIVRFSYKELEDLEKQQREVENRWGKVQTPSFKIELQARPFEMLKALCETFFGVGKVRFWGGPDVELGDRIDLLSLWGGFGEHGYTWREGYPCFEHTEGQHSLLIKEERLQSEVKSKTLVDIYTLIRELLEVDFSPDHTFNFIVAAAFYAAIEHQDFGEQRYKMRVKFHKNVRALALNATVRRGDRDTTQFKNRATSAIGLEESEELDEYMRLWRGEFELPNAAPTDYLFVNLMQTEPPTLDIYKPSYPTQISRFVELKKPAKEPLLAAFRRFCVEDELEGYLTQPGQIQAPSPKKPSSAFEGFVSWILGVCGFQSVWLGWTKHETLKEGKVEHLRLDILAYYEKKNTLLLVACTTGHPNQDIDTVNSIKRKLYEEVFKDTSIQIKGFIFSSQSSVDVAKQRGEEAGVTVFGADDIRGILNYVREGAIPRALSDYFGFSFEPKMGE